MNIAVYAGSRELYPYMLGSIKSMFANGNVDKVYMIIEDDNFPEEICDGIEIINFSNQTFFGNGCPNMRTRFTYVTLARACLCSLLPDSVDKVLSMDCDTVVKMPLDELWEKDLGDYYISATREPQNCRWNRLYFNTGVCLMNLKLMRQDGIGDKLIDWLNKNPSALPEQNALNTVCAGRILDMPSTFNYNDYVAKPPNKEEIRVRHFAGSGAHIWGYVPEMTEYIKMPWSEVMKRRERWKSE